MSNDSMGFILFFLYINIILQLLLETKTYCEFYFEHKNAMSKTVIWYVLLNLRLNRIIFLNKNKISSLKKWRKKNTHSCSKTATATADEIEPLKYIFAFFVLMRVFLLLLFSVKFATLCWVLQIWKLVSAIISWRLEWINTSFNVV